MRAQTSHVPILTRTACSGELDRVLGVELGADGAIATSLGFLVARWFVYDVICRAFGQKKNGDLIVGVGVFAKWR